MNGIFLVGRTDKDKIGFAVSGDRVHVEIDLQK